MKLVLSDIDKLILSKMKNVNDKLYMYKDCAICITEDGGISSRYEFEDEKNIDKKLGIYSISSLLSSISTLGQPEIEIKPKNLKLNADNIKYTYNLTPEDYNLIPKFEVFKEKKQQLFDMNNFIKLSIDEHIMKKLIDGQNIVGTENIYIYEQDGVIKFRIAENFEIEDSYSGMQNNWEISLNKETEDVKNFSIDTPVKLQLKISSLLQGDYSLILFNIDGLVKAVVFENNNSKIDYLVKAIISNAQVNDDNEETEIDSDDISDEDFDI